MNEFFDVGVFAAYHSGAGGWSVIAPGRFGADRSFVAMP
jgi:hypothetical protein